MLSGIKAGKKKKRKQQPPPPPTEQQQPQPPTEHKPKTNEPFQKNESAADELRRALASGKKPPMILTAGKAAAGQRSTSSIESQLIHRGLIQVGAASGEHHPATTDHIITYDGACSTMTTSSSNRINNGELSIAQMVAQEKQDSASTTTLSWNEQMTRNAMRLGRHIKRKRGNDDDSDEEVEHMTKLLNADNDRSRSSNNEQPSSLKEERQREQQTRRHEHRLVAQHQQRQNVTSKCSWWIESSSFHTPRLLAVGKHWSLVYPPPSATLIPKHHFYLVPLKHASSVVEAMEDDDDRGVWEELQQFQTSLNNLFARQGKAILWMETVLNNNGAGLWQTKLDVLAVPFATVQDAPIYFKSAMAEQREEWGTHNKLLQLQTHQSLTNVIPKSRGFPYFCVYWGSIATHPTTSGFAQLIESSENHVDEDGIATTTSSSSSFPKDFGLDTLAGMLEMDPLRMQRHVKKKGAQEEQAEINEFAAKWAKFDWTKKLDR